jgi:hypothetical protein
MPFASPLARHGIVLAIMYGTWSRGNIHARDIEVKRFIAKFTKVTPSGYAASLQEILAIHNAMLERLKSCEIHFTDEDLELEKFDGFLQAERNPLFLDQHKVEPHFCALIVVVTPVLEILRKMWRNRRCGSFILELQGSVEPISFHIFGEGNMDMVTIPMEDAIR